MKNIIWINLLHFYQPPTADKETVIQAAEKSYRRIINALTRNPRIKFTVNLTGCLLEKLDSLGYGALLKQLKTLSDSGQIEITDSAAFHAILPLLPKNESLRNIEIHQAIRQKYFGDDLRPTGFFPPELAYDQKIGRQIAQLGYQWVALDEIAATGRLDGFDPNKLYSDAGTGLKICFRSRNLSKSYVPKNIFKLIEKKYSGPIITITDAELYGLRHQDQTATFEKLLKRPEITTMTVSQYLDSLSEKIILNTLASSWESTSKELQKKMPFALWQNDKNKIQKLLWQLADLAIDAVGQYKNDSNYSWARNHLDKGLSSCTFWWASGRDFKLFSSISWNPDEIERGLDELIKSIRAVADPSSRPIKIRAEKLYIKIKTLIWRKHWNYYWQP